MGNTITCPLCTRQNRPDATRCVCGYEFPESIAELSSPAGEFRMFGVEFQAGDKSDDPLRRDTAERFRKHKSRSRVLAAVGACVVTCAVAFGSSESLPGPSAWDLVLFFLCALYAIWAVWWGFIALWDPWMRNVEKAGEGPSDSRLVAALFALALIVGIVYGILGGGIREFIRRRRFAAQVAPKPN